MLLNQAAVKAHARDLRPGIRVAKDYIDALNGKVAAMIAADLRIIGGRKTLKGSVIRYCDQVNALARPRRRGVR